MKMILVVKKLKLPNNRKMFSNTIRRLKIN